MSDKDPKKAGARDISDLKARLGVGGKKAGAGGLPGVKAPGAVPPPPGLAPPQPQLPDARVDPFAAMNVIAAAGAVHQMAAPTPIVITAEDSKVIKSVRTKTRARYIKWGVGIFLTLVFGFIVGGISYKNATYNNTIDSAKVLTEQFRTVRVGLDGVNGALLEAKGRNAQEMYVPSDEALTASLKGLVLQKPDAKILFHSYLYELDPKLVEDVFQFYSDLSTLYDRIGAHVKKSESDSKKSYAPNAKKSATGRFGAIIDVPTGQQANEPPTVSIVEVGSPICSDQQAHPESCKKTSDLPLCCPDGKAPIGWEYRRDATATTWGKKAWALKAEQYSPEAIFLLDGDPNMTALSEGAEKFVDRVMYMNRIIEIDAMTTNLTAERKRLEDRLNQKAQEGKRFSL